MTDKELAREIAAGLIATGVESDFSGVSRTTSGGDYISIGVSQWEGARADALLDSIAGGGKFIGRTYSGIVASGDLEELKYLLGTEEGINAQVEMLENDCLNMYIPAIKKIPKLDDSRVFIYLGIWCPTSHNSVRAFVTNRSDRNVRSLGTIRNMFRDEYAYAVGCEDYAVGYANRAENTYQYVAGLDLTTPYGVPAYGETENGR